MLEEIRKEKLSHGLDFANAKSGKRKSKKETALAGSNPCDITEDEIPFEIPKNWCWCRLGDLGLYRKGPFGSSLTKSMFVPKSDDSIKVYEQKNAIKKDFSLGEYYISKEKFETMQSFIVEPSDIIVSCAGTIGEVYKLPHEAPIGIINQALMRVKLFNDKLSSFWMMYFDYVLKKEAAKQGSGTAIKNIPPFEILKAYPFPLPPLAEQKRIVAAIEKFMPLIEEYSKKETELKAINEKIGTFTKKAILQEAVQGKLVPQIASEGNARDLLEEIRKERLSHGFANSYGICDEKGKKSKSSDLRSKSQIRVTKKELQEITEDEIPFDIPENWCWCKIEDITIPIGNKNNQIQSKEVLKDGKIPVVSQGQNLIDGYSNETEKAIKDIPVIMFGDHTRNVKYIDFPFIIGVDGTKFFKPILCNKYYIYYLITFISLKLRNRGYARHYSLLKEEWLPLPPLVEQKRIVDAIEKLLPLCEKLGEK
ncbi:MAG: restriction endonuclease subunit S [Treponema sp.]|nr:restriction endonuclease subunit S [Treponema sp.]